MNRKSHRLIELDWVLVVVVALALVSLRTDVKAQEGFPLFSDVIHQGDWRAVIAGDIDGLLERRDSFDAVVSGERVTNAGVLLLAGHNPLIEDSVCVDVYLLSDDGGIVCVRVCGNQDRIRRLFGGGW